MTPPGTPARQAAATVKASCLSGALARAARVLVGRLNQLEDRLGVGDEAWGLYLDAVNALTGVVTHLPPQRREVLLTTSEMAAQLNLSPKTLLKRKARGEIRPALQRGKLIRWKGDEELR